MRATIKAGSRTQRAVAGVLLGASLAHVRARRLADGLDLRYARQAPPAVAVMWAVAVSAVLYPLHRLAQILVFHKIRCGRFRYSHCSAIQQALLCIRPAR